MGTSFLDREEMHDRVDHLYDHIEDGLDEDDEPIAVIGSMIGNLSVGAPSESRDHFEASPTIGYASFTFDEDDALTLGESLRNRSQRALTGTVLVPKSELHPTVSAALDGDEEAREALATGSVGEGGDGDDA